MVIHDSKPTIKSSTIDNIIENFGFMNPITLKIETVYLIFLQFIQNYKFWEINMNLKRVTNNNLK